MSGWVASHRRLAIFGTLIALQLVAVLAFIAREEVFLRTGTEILVESRPVDPRDPLRGDFVILSYRFEALSGREVPGATCCYARGDDAYVWLQQRGRFWEPYLVTEGRPGRDELAESNAVAIRGQVQRSEFGSLDLTFKNIGQFFVPDGEGNPPSPPDVRLVIDGDGSARIRGLEIDGEPWP